MLQILNNLRSHWQGKDITEADILNWANRKVKKMGRTSQAVSFKVKKRVKTMETNPNPSPLNITVLMVTLLGQESVKWNLLFGAFECCRAKSCKLESCNQRRNR